MTVRSSGVTKHLLERVLNDQKRRTQREQRMPFSQKLKVLDRLMAEGLPKVEDAKD